MMAALILKLRRSKATNPIFGDRVTGIADASRAMEYSALDYPAAYVCMLSETAEEQPPGSNENRQRMSQIWGIVVALDARPDVRGQAPSMTLDQVRPALFRAIYNWSPDKAHGNLWYDSLKLLQVNRDATYWLFAFGTHMWVCGEQGIGETEEQFDPLPNLDGIDFHVDWLEPFDPGLPPSQAYKPEYPPPRTYGPDGRIESEFKQEFEHPVQPPLPRRKRLQ